MQRFFDKNGRQMNLKERIIENASDLFLQKGVKSMTMSDIANELGVSKRTLYEVFRDKEDLLENCIWSHLAKVDKAIRTLAENSEDVIDTVMRAYGRYLNETKTINRSVIHDLKKYHSVLYKKVAQKQKENMSLFLPLFEKGIRQGLIRDDINFEIILWLVRSQFRSLMNDDYFPTDKYSVNEFIQVIILNFIRGIATPSGVKKVDDIVEKMRNNKLLNITEI